MFIQYWESFLRPYQGAGAISASGNGSDVIQDGGRKRKLHLHLDGVSKGLSILLHRNVYIYIYMYIHIQSYSNRYDVARLALCTMPDHLYNPRGISFIPLGTFCQSPGHFHRICDQSYIFQFNACFCYSFIIDVFYSSWIVLNNAILYAE